jgi:hypothetical protein
MTESQAAAYLRLRPLTLANWRTTKRYALPYVRVGRLIRYRLKDLEAFISSRTVGRDGQ